jgi:hypothetical protein
MMAGRARIVLLAAVTAILALPAAVQAKVPIYSVDQAVSSTQGGAHADVLTSFELGTPLPGGSEPWTLPCHCNVPRDIKVNTPAGLIAAPGNVPQCTTAQLSLHECPSDSQLGLSVVRLQPEEASGSLYHFAPLFNMIAGDDQLALLGTLAPLAGTPIFIEVTARTEGDYGLEFKTFGIPSVFAVTHISTIFWGVPGDPVHDPLRFPFKANASFCQGKESVGKLFANLWPCGADPEGPHPTASNSPLAPFVQNPTACLGSLPFSVETASYDLEIDHVDSSFSAITGCDQLSFDPSLAAKPTTTEADSPSGLDVDLTVPQSVSPNASTPSAIRDVTLTLPAGMSVSSNAADGKLACTAAQARFGTREAAQCPEHAKIGTIAITSSSLPGVLPGALYLGEPQPGNRYRVFMVFDGFGIHVKLPGSARLDPSTGQTSVTFTDLPQFNFQEFDMHVFGAERGLLSTPVQCGTYPVETEFVPWAAPDIPVQTSTQFFVIDSGPGGTACPPAQRPFSPEARAGVTDNTAGSHAGFVFDLTRKDGDQGLAALDVTTPPGFSATLAGIPYCPDVSLGVIAAGSYLGVTEQATPVCPASQIGIAYASAGAGSRPVSLPGKVYLAGPYRGAPLSLAVVTPAVSGPYDLGNVVVRAALRVDPVTAQVTAISDPLPRILEGIPLRLRRIVVDLDRPDFVLNPTNCEPFSVEAAVTGDQGAQAMLRAPFQVANCAGLPYGPKLSLTLSGGLNRLGHPSIHAVFAAKPGEANSRRVSVTLPKGELLDNAHIGSPCTRVQFAARACPASALLGTAQVTTPLLDSPLKGKAYLRSSSHELPDLVLDLQGQVDFQLVGRVDSVNARLRTTFETVPDVPVSRFVLDLAGGKKGLLQNSKRLCGAGKAAAVRMIGQNGAVLNTRSKLRTKCGRG